MALRCFEHRHKTFDRVEGIGKSYGGNKYFDMSGKFHVAYTRSSSLSFDIPSGSDLRCNHTGAAQMLHRRGS
jgi:hypothetical protein